MVSVPSRGLRYLNTYELKQRLKDMGFRPLTGIKVSERQMKNFRGTTPEVSVPSRGLRYLNQTAMLHYIHQRYVSVPSRGLRYLNQEYLNRKGIEVARFRPLTGIKVSEL